MTVLPRQWGHSWAFWRWRNGHFGDFGADMDGFSSSDSSGAAFIAIYHCVNGPEALFMVSDRFL